MPGLLQLPTEATTRQITAALAQLCRDRGWSELEVTMACAQLLGHMAATLDLKEGTRSLPDRLDAFCGVVEDTYARSIRRPFRE